MSKVKPLHRVMDVEKVFVSEGGKHYRGTRQDFDPIIKHVNEQKELINEAPKSGNRNNWHYGGSIPMTLLVDWLQKNGYGVDEFARSRRDDPYGPKYKFLKYFKSREFSKLHTDHVTTRKESSQIFTG